MSQPFSRILHPFDAERQPRFEPEVAHAVLARLASDRAAPCDRSGFGRPTGTNRAHPLRRGRMMPPTADGRGGERPRAQ